MSSFGRVTPTTLRFFDVFDSLNVDDLEALCHFSTLNLCTRGKLLIEQGQESHWVFFILSGVLVYTRNVVTPDSALNLNDVVVQFFGQGEAIGDATIFNSVPFRGTVKVVKTATILFVDREKLADMALRHPQLLKTLYMRTGDKMFKIVEGIDVAYGRLLRRIEVLAAECNKVGINLYSNFSKSDIARMLGVSRVAISQSLNKGLHKEGST